MTFASANLMPYAYFLVGFILPSLLTTQPSLSNFVVVNADLMSAISKLPLYCLVIRIALLLGEEFGKFPAFASILPTLPYFVVDVLLPSLLKTKPSVSHSLVVDVGLMLAILQFSSYSLLICIALLLVDEFGEFASFATFTACKQDSLLLFYILPCCLLMNLVNSPRFPDSSNLPCSPLVLSALLSLYSNSIIVLPFHWLKNLVN